jgi:diaminopropionate ammonia-lyase
VNDTPPTHHLHLNPRVRRDRPYDDALRRILDEAGCDAARREIGSWPGYAPTPLRSLPGLAARHGVAAMLYKDEGERFGLGSFKALGGAYAVYRHLADAVARRAGHHPGAAELASGAHADVTGALTVCCATDGNHGRSVAWGARTFGCRCVIYIHETVSTGREEAIAAYGARVVRNPGGYDDAVHRAAADAAANGWTVVSDTSYEGYTDIPRDVMHGYTVMVDEVVRALPDARPPSHVFVQGGVGGVAAAVCARLWWQLEGSRPFLVVVEPERAACLYESARAGQRVALDGDIDTVMAGLSCGETSLLAFELLDPGADAFMTIPDGDALAMMRTLALGVDGDPPVVAGESAVAGIAGFAAAAGHPASAAALGLDASSRVLVFGTEGDTDPALYREIVGRPASAVRRA